MINRRLVRDRLAMWLGLGSREERTKKKKGGSKRRGYRQPGKGIEMNEVLKLNM